MARQLKGKISKAPTYGRFGVHSTKKTQTIGRVLRSYHIISDTILLCSFVGWQSFQCCGYLQIYTARHEKCRKKCCQLPCVIHAQAMPRVGWHGLSFNAFMVSPMALLEQMNTWQVWETKGLPFQVTKQ